MNQSNRECVPIHGVKFRDRMPMDKPIRAACRDDFSRNGVDWVFVDPGFASKKRSCGFLINDGSAQELSFVELRTELCALMTAATVPLNVVIEAPLSVAFSQAGNPVGRAFELRDGKSRYWYVGLGCSVLVSAAYLMRALVDSGPQRQIRLFEGFVTFKKKGARSSHAQDVLDLRRVVYDGMGATGVLWPEQFRQSKQDCLQSAFSVSGMDFGIPPVIIIEPR